MCIKYMTGVRKTEKDLTAFKLVRKDDVKKDKFSSFFSPRDRFPQKGHDFEKIGRTLIYEIGKLKKSDMSKTPGLYLYKYYKSLRFYSSACILKVKIPAGTKVRFGVDDTGRRHCICAESIIPLSVTKWG